MAPPYTAYLRVYEPLHAFPPDEQEHWRAYAAAGHAPPRAHGPRLEHQAAVANLLAVRPRKRDEQAFVRVYDGVTLVCPWRTSIRAWETAVDVRSSVAGVLADAFVPQVLADATQADAEAFRAAHPQARSHIMVANWAVPLRWFAIVEAAERDVRLGPAGRAAKSGPDRRTAGEGGGDADAAGSSGGSAGSAAGEDGPASNGSVRAFVYTTEMSRARRRAARALAVVRKALGEHAAVSAAVEELARWLEEFHPRSLIELDYGGLVDILSDEALRSDHSAEDVAEALVGLGAGDEERASAAYERIVERWRPAQLMEGAN